MTYSEKWILAARPKTLWASIAPVVVGTALAYGDGAHHWPSALIALACAVLIQIGTNFANDYFDYEKGADTEERMGPLRVTQSGMVSSTTMKWATAATFFLACVGGAILTWRGGWPIAVVGLLCILSGLLYTGGPYPLGYLGLGDLFVLIFFGPVAVGGTYYVQALQVNTTVLVAGMGPGLLITAILTVNNLRDIEVDRKAGKRTLAVRFGKTFTRWEYAFLVLVGISIPPFLYLRSGQHLSSLLSLLVVLPAISTFKGVFGHAEGPSLNPVLANTARMSLLYSLLFSVGWLL
ncbi:MAG: 1,4-dihydroxy-2-naphthoate polyprenyltransferase [Deltaproteobacteria bacterium]|nr:1,4-dihydroxy-2-naphthoate polyprenyltransferase [Deltaproteobacteria bacterium]